MRFYGIILSVALLTGCASLSEEECRVGDWQGIGYNDGTQGRLVTYFAEHVQACKKMGIYPNRQQWLQGREQGLPHYCRAENAYQRGKDGWNFNPVCPVWQLDELSRAHQLGKEYANVHKSLQRDYHQRRVWRDELRKLRKGENLRFETEREARVYLLQLPYQLQKLDWQIEQKKARLEDLKW